MDYILKAAGISHMIVRHSWLVFIVGLRMNVSCEYVGSFCSLQQSIDLICVHTAYMDVQTLPPPPPRDGVCCGKCLTIFLVQLSDEE
jgi:hypothetical protein